MAARATLQPDAHVAPGQMHLSPLFSDSPQFRLGDLVALNAEAALRRNHRELRADPDPIDWPAIDRIHDDPLDRGIPPWPVGMDQP